jgi:glycosyltransferase involved in cell wall biosynthesis
LATKVCFLGGARYSRPLDATSEKKFRALKSLGDIFVIGFSQDLRPRRFAQHASFYLLPKLPVAFLRYVETFMIAAPLVLWLIFRSGVQVLVAQSPFEGSVAALAKTIAGWFGHKIVLVVESHGDFEESLFMHRSVVFPGLYRHAMLYAARFALKHGDSFRVISDSTKEQMERWVPGRRIIQFPTWTDIEVFLKAGVEKRAVEGQDILYTGALIPRKGVHHLINAFARVAKDFPQARLILLGHEENKTYTAELKEQVKRLGADGRVQFIGAMPQAELATWMRRASVFVLPSVSEGLGRVVVEAMASGTPVIGSNVGGIPEMVQDGVTGFLIPPGDETVLAAKLRWMLENPDKTREMGHFARAFAERFFSTKVYINGYKQILEVAQDILSEDGERAPSTL